MTEAITCKKDKNTLVILLYYLTLHQYNHNFQHKDTESTNLVASLSKRLTKTKH